VYKWSGNWADSCLIFVLTIKQPIDNNKQTDNIVAAAILESILSKNEQLAIEMQRIIIHDGFAYFPIVD
jgi:hypothetical protein